MPHAQMPPGLPVEELARLQRSATWTPTDDSMTPTIRPGEMALIDCTDTLPEVGAVYLIELPHGFQLRRLLALNGPSQVWGCDCLPFLALADSARIAGRVWAVQPRSYLI